METGKEYRFELNDRLIRDKECDGWKEIPVQPEWKESDDKDVANDDEKKVMDGEDKSGANQGAEDDDLGKESSDTADEVELPENQTGAMEKDKGANSESKKSKSDIENTDGKQGSKVATEDTRLKPLPGINSILLINARILFTTSKECYITLSIKPLQVFLKIVTLQS